VSGIIHHPVEQHEVGAGVQDLPHRLAGVGRLQAVEAGQLQRELHHVPDRGLVVHHQDRLLAVHPFPSPRLVMIDT